MQTQVKETGFHDRPRVAGFIARIRSLTPSGIESSLLILPASSPDPDRALAGPMRTKRQLAVFQWTARFLCPFLS